MSKKLQKEADPREKENWFSLEELSEQWDKPVSFIEQACRRGKFDRVILRSKKDPRHTDHIFFDKNQWPHGKRLWFYHSQDRVGQTDTLMDRKKLTPGGWLVPEGFLVLIPEEEARKFEQAHNLTSEQDPTPPPHLQTKWIKSEELRAALMAHHELYALGKLDPKKGAKDQIKHYLKRFRGLSDNQIKRIAQVVNPNKKGGAPPST